MKQRWISLLLSFLVLATPIGAWAKEQELSLDDLGFSSKQMRADEGLQRTLTERRMMLRQHQIWGLVSLGLMGAALLTGGEGNAPPEHTALGAATAATYGVSAYFAIAAPDLPTGVEASGGSRWHRRLAWIHGIGMIATPILGYMAAKRYERGEKLSSLESQHKNVAGVTAGALAISVALVSFEF